MSSYLAQIHQRLLSFLAGLSVILLSSCAQLPSDPLPFNKDIPEAWQITAKLGINSPEQSGSVTLQWQQRDDAYHIRVQGPLGQGGAIIIGNDQGVIIERANEPRVKASNPEALMHETFGWALPLTSLRYWVRGLPHPEKAIIQSQRNANGSLAFLEQSGWRIGYSRYSLAENWLVPGKMITQIGETRLTLLIRDWQFGQTQ